MALMFDRLARNFAKAGYFPTDAVTLERALQALAPAESGCMRLLDPCAGEGIALAEAAHHLGREACECFAVEYDAQRAEHARTLTDRCLRSDVMDCMISRQSFGLLWLNPPYGDLSKDPIARTWSNDWKSSSINAASTGCNTVVCWSISFRTMCSMPNCAVG